MSGKLTVSLVSERQDGKIGDDWKYDLEVKVFNQGLKGKGKISVPKHNLGDGMTMEPHGNPDDLVLDAGDSGSELKIWMKLIATEVDAFRNDVGESDLNFTMPCPESGHTPVVFEKEISCGVTEKPVIADNTAIFKLVVRLTASSD
ncbi:MAG: hypothetical protein R3348_03055 [Xanthomonadales bacterium]|nr:hypothetical protein [Xanthomonadales bacterium]